MRTGCQKTRQEELGRRCWKQRSDSGKAPRERAEGCLGRAAPRAPSGGAPTPVPSPSLQLSAPGRSHAGVFAYLPPPSQPERECCLLPCHLLWSLRGPEQQPLAQHTLTTDSTRCGCQGRPGETRFQPGHARVLSTKVPLTYREGLRCRLRGHSAVSLTLVLR